MKKSIFTIIYGLISTLLIGFPIAILVATENSIREFVNEANIGIDTAANIIGRFYVGFTLVMSIVILITTILFINYIKFIKEKK